MISVSVLLDLIAGLVLFLFGVFQLAAGVEAVAGDRAKALLVRWTSNRFLGVLTGAVATAVLDSSSVTIILVIALVNGRVLTFTQSLGVILGANIGTTLSSQIFAMDAEAYAPLVMLIGFGLFVTARANPRLRHVGLSVFGLGLVFFGLRFMGDAVAPLRDDARVLAWLSGLEQPLLGALTGTVLTIVLQSSSAMLGLIIVLAGQQLLTLPAGLAVMLGAEIGTCADTLVASIGRSAAAIRAGVFHLVFNLSSAAVGLFFLDALATAARSLPGGDELPRQIANAHVLFNVVGVAAVIGVLPLVARALESLIPDRVPMRASTPEREHQQAGLADAGSS